MSALDWSSYASALPGIAAAVGHTPLVRLNRVTAGLGPPIYVKIEWYGATGSLKDRIYLHLFERAEARGELRPGVAVLECSTGNAGIACAWVAAVKGYPCTIVMPEGMSDERKKIMRAYGAELVFTPGGESDVDLALERLAEIRAAAPGRYWVPGQFDNPDNVEAHTLSTGPEVWAQMGGRIGAFVDSQGSGGLLTGVGRYLRARDPGVRLYAVEPAECALLARREWGHHGIEGIGDGFVPRNLDVSLLTGIITTTTEESVEMARALAAREGIFCGISSGCNVAAAVKLARRHPALASIVTIICDTGQRYFTTPLCGEKKQVAIPERDHPLDRHTVAELDRYQSGWEILT
ncbi:MAG: PLP-dependent cysteine synthase family protein [Candidatus Rokubacteria bacterium]|nr:PLP-dependent cysteine synthase family protein [Candidatus Rokubacteria bacterium]